MAPEATLVTQIAEARQCVAAGADEARESGCYVEGDGLIVNEREYLTLLDVVEQVIHVLPLMNALGLHAGPLEDALDRLSELYANGA